jgi:hypothetical protein
MPKGESDDDDNIHVIMGGGSWVVVACVAMVLTCFARAKRFSDEKNRINLGGNIVPIGEILAGTTNPIGTGTEIGRNWV